MNDLVATLYPLIVSFTISLIAAPAVISWYRKKGWLDNPEVKKHPKIIHTQPVPRGGGLVIFTAVLISAVIFLPLDKHLIGILLGAAVLVVVGFLDDLYDLNPYLRLFTGLVAAGCVVGSGIGIAFFSNPFPPPDLIMLNEPQIPVYLFGKMRTIWVLADIFAVLWIVGLMNFVNWSKGLDGQLPGTVVIAAVTIFALSERFSADIAQWQTGVLALIVAGAFFGFLPWNIFPQKMMPGYGAGSLAGYLLALLAILSTTKVNTLIIVLGLPLIDALYVSLRRIANGKLPFWGDTRHLHHTLLTLGWTKRQVAFFYWAATAVLGFIALQLNSQQKFATIGLLILGFGAFLIWIKFFMGSSSRRGQGNG